MTILTLHFISGGDLFLTLARSTGAFIIFVWIFIIFAHVGMRLKTRHEVVDPTSFRAWGFPLTNVIALLALVSVLATQAIDPATRFQFWLVLVTLLVIVAAYFMVRRRRSGEVRELART